MKKIAVIIALLVAVNASGQIERAKLTASGLTCSMCSKAIYEALSKIKFIESVQANIQESSYIIAFKKDIPTDLDAIRSAVEGAGFSVAKLQITINFNNADVQNDAMIQLNGKAFHFLNIVPQTLTGEQTLTMLDEKFTNAKEHKKYAQYTTMKCFTTGIAQACCSKDVQAGQRIFHVTI